MPKYYLRVEGVNLDAFIFDTNDLNTIRGGSLLLLDAVEELHTRVPDCKPVTLGASWGLFSVNARSDREAARIAATVRRQLGCKTRRHATFVVDILPAGDPPEYTAVRDRLQALNRWRQMQSPAVVVPEEAKPSCDTPVCELNQVRPCEGGTEQIRGRERCLSPSVRDRRRYGQKQKQDFYQRITEIDETYVNEFDELTDAPDQGRLHHKMAIIYLDGNQFGKIAREYCTTAEKQHRFDTRVRIQYRNGALKTLLADIRDDPDWKNGQKIRLETLLWGGDEIIWVAPAWKGWWLLSRFFQITCGKDADGKKNKEPWKVGERRLTHAAGLVFCHHNAPIHPVTELARRLGDLAKREKRANRVAYQILESFDHTGADLQGVRDRRSGPLVGEKELLLNGDAMPAAGAAVIWFRQNLPKRRLYRIVETLLIGGDVEKEIENTAELATPDAQKNRRDLKRCFGGSPALWLHLLELWDYIREPTS